MERKTRRLYVLSEATAYAFDADKQEDEGETEPLRVLVEDAYGGFNGQESEDKRLNKGRCREELCGKRREAEGNGRAGEEYGGLIYELRLV